MTSLTSSFHNQCFQNNSELSFSCYEGFAVIFFGILLFSFNSFAFIKMTQFYKKMNFENTFLLLSTIQSLVLIIELTLFQDFLIGIFYFIQILSMCLINLKFKNTSKGFVHVKYINTTKIIIVINTLYIFIYFILYFITRSIADLHIMYFKIIFYILEVISCFLLTYVCCIFLGIINIQQHQKEEKAKKNEINEKENTNNIKSKSSDSKKNIANPNMAGDGKFYSIKKKQFNLIYIGNIIFISLELILDIAVFVIIKYFDEKYLNYVRGFYFLVCFLNNSIIFISFYWIVRAQYDFQPKQGGIDIEYTEQIDGLIDDKEIEEDVINNEKENKKLSDYLDDDGKKAKILIEEKTTNECDENENNVRDSKAATFFGDIDELNNDLNSYMIVSHEDISQMNFKN